MAKYISELQVSLNPDEEAVLEEKGFSKINVDLNQGSRDNKTFIWFKRGTEGICHIQLSYSLERSDYLKSSGYTLIEKNLNPDSSGDPIYLCYYKGHMVSGDYIVELDVTADPDDEAKKRSSGWERMGYELSRKPTGPKVYLWMRREIEASDDCVEGDSFGSGSRPECLGGGSANVRLSISYDVPDSPF